MMSCSQYILPLQGCALREATCACVVRVEGGVVSEREVRDWTAATLAEYKVPDLVSFIDDLPLAGTGTVRCHELARRLSSALRDTSAERREATTHDRRRC